MSVEVSASVVVGQPQRTAELATCASCGLEKSNIHSELDSDGPSRIVPAGRLTAGAAERLTAWETAAHGTRREPKP